MSLIHQYLIKDGGTTECNCCCQNYSIVKCCSCQKKMPYHSKDFFAVYGNITIGVVGGLVGNNFDDEGGLKRVSILCKKCFNETFEGI